jgi:hypothetical protein
MQMNREEQKAPSSYHKNGVAFGFDEYRHFADSDVLAEDNSRLHG